MNDIAFIIIAIAAVLLVAFLIPALIELRKTLKRVQTFMDTTEKDISTTMVELRATLENLKSITEDVETVTNNVRGITSSLEETVHILEGVKRFLNTVQVETNATIAGLKEGIKTAAAVFVKNIVSKGG